MLGDEKAIPLGDFNPSLRLQLRLGVGGDYASGAWKCRVRPDDDPRDEGRLANPVAGRDGEKERRLYGDDSVAELSQYPDLPLIRSFLFQFRSFLAPRKRPMHEGDGVVGVGTEFLDEVCVGGHRNDSTLKLRIE